MPDTCPFCRIDASRIIHETAFCFAIRDGYPISRGHTLIIPKRHVVSFFDITVEERSDLMDALSTMKKNLETEFQPDGYNIGINDGASAGQTVMHLHIHLIPRYTGDTPDPRGGIRSIFPQEQIDFAGEDFVRFRIKDADGDFAAEDFDRGEPRSVRLQEFIQDICAAHASRNAA